MQQQWQPPTPGAGQALPPVPGTRPPIPQPPSQMADPPVPRPPGSDGPAQQPQVAGAAPAEGAQQVAPKKAAPQPGPGTDHGLLEKTSGVRLSWHVWPESATAAESMAAPLGILYIPMKTVDGIARLEQDPVRCAVCGGALNLFSSVDMQSGRWHCPLCNGWSPLPASFAELKAPPAEMRSEHSTVEYELPGPSAGPSAVLIVADCSLPADEFARRGSIPRQPEPEPQPQRHPHSRVLSPIPSLLPAPCTPLPALPALPAPRSPLPAPCSLLPAP